MKLLFLLFSQFLFHLLVNGAQLMVEIEPDWKSLPEYRSLLEPEEFREVFQSNRFELQIYKEAIQEGISIAGSRVRNDRDVFLFENIPEDWMEPTGLVLEIKLPPILSVKKLLLNEESFYQPRIRRPFHISRNRNMLIHKFSILENHHSTFYNKIILPMGETPQGGNEVAYMESLNNSLTKLEQSEQLCAQTKYECNLNLLLKYTHVERQFDAFLKNVLKRTLTVSAQNYATIKAKSVKLFSDIIKLAMTVLEEEKKLFNENASSPIDLHNLYNSSPAVPIPTLHLHAQHQHGLDSSQSSHTQTPTSAGTTSSAAGALPLNRKISFELIPIERIAQILAGLNPSRISQPSQINISAGTNQERMKFIMSDFLSSNSLNSAQSAHFQVGQQQQQRGTGQTSHGVPSAGQTQAKGREKVADVDQPATNVEAIFSSEENDPPNPMGQEQMHSSENVPVAENNKKSLLKTSVKIRQEFESEKKKYQSEMAANTSASKSEVPTAAANKTKSTDEPRAIGDREREILWKHFVKFADIWTSDHDPSDRDAHGEKRVAEEQQERFAFTDELGLKRSQTYNKKSLLKTSDKIRQEFEYWKKKYQAEMAVNTGASKSKVPTAANRFKHSNAPFDVHQTAALWRHLVRFEDVWITQSADLNKQKEEDEERSKLKKSIKLKWRQIYRWLQNTKSRLNTQEKTRQEYEYWKKEYQSEMAATGVDNASASASKVAEAAANKTSNVEVISSSEETDPNPLAIVPYEPMPNDPIAARPLNWRLTASDKTGRKRKHSTEIIPVARDEKRAKPNQGTSASAPAELPSPAVNLNKSNPQEEEEKMQEDD